MSGAGATAWQGAWTRRACALACVIVAIVIMLATPITLRGAAPAAANELTQTPVGIEGRHILRVTGARAGSVMLATLGERPALLVRIAATQREGDAMLYDLRYVGRRGGEFDLREALQYVDGGRLDDVVPVIVGIKAGLPDDHDLLMVELAAKTPSMMRWYTLGLIVVATLWLAPIVALVVRRIAAARAARATPAGPPPSLWDLLRPLLERAARGELSVQEQAKLEMLALGAWIERLELKRERHATVMAKLREHPDASRAVDVLSRWLHARNPDVESLRGELGLLVPPERSASGGAIVGGVEGGTGAGGGGATSALAGASNAGGAA